MIEVNNFSKHYGSKVAVDNATFKVETGKVTGFLGPNGAGKSTTMRCVVGLDKPTNGSITVDGKPFYKHKKPVKTVGALLDAKAFHQNRTAYNHLKFVARANGIGKKRIKEVIEYTGIGKVAKKNVGQFSLGMAQRVGIATAILGEPDTLILDEPVNGLDPEGVIWVRNLCRDYAKSGRTVFVSSHLMSEVEQTVDNLVIIGKGKIIEQGKISDMIDRHSANIIKVVSPDKTKLINVLKKKGVSYDIDFENVHIKNYNSSDLANIILENKIRIYELVHEKSNLEQMFIKLTHDAVEYKSTDMQKGGKNE